MEFEHIFKIVISSLVALAVGGYSSMTKDVTTNKAEIKNMKGVIIKMDKKIDDIHWHFIRSKK